MKRIIILAAVQGSAQGYRFALWASVPAARQPFYANPEKTSAWKDASQAEIDALRNGSVVEKVEHFNNETALSLALVKAQLEARWTAFQAEVDAHNPWDRYGSYWDSAGPAWTNGGVN